MNIYLTSAVTNLRRELSEDGISKYRKYIRLSVMHTDEHADTQDASSSVRYSLCRRIKFRAPHTVDVL